jgi:hypothetical protein
MFGLADQKIFSIWVVLCNLIDFILNLYFNLIDYKHQSPIIFASHIITNLMIFITTKELNQY